MPSGFMSRTTVKEPRGHLQVVSDHQIDLDAVARSDDLKTGNAQNVLLFELPFLGGGSRRLSGTIRYLDWILDRIYTITKNMSRLGLQRHH